MGAKHGTNPEMKVDCGECGKSFKNDETLRLHMIYMHLKVNKYECDKCDGKFSRKDNLRRHQGEYHSDLKLEHDSVKTRSSISM